MWLQIIAIFWFATIFICMRSLFNLFILFVTHSMCSFQWRFSPSLISKNFVCVTSLSIGIFNYYCRYNCIIWYLFVLDLSKKYIPSQLLSSSSIVNCIFMVDNCIIRCHNDGYFILLSRYAPCVSCLTGSVAVWCLRGWRGRPRTCCCWTNLLTTWTWRPSTRWATPSTSSTAAWCWLATTSGSSTR